MKSILVFSNGEKIGDGIIKLPLLHEIKKRLPEYKLHWMTNIGLTVYNSVLKNISSKYIDQIYEQANLNFFYWNTISKKFDFDNTYFDYIFDTQKSFFRTAALKRIKHGIFISATANGLFSSIKLNNNLKKRKYYLENLYDLLDLIKESKIEDNFLIPISNDLENQVKNLLPQNKKYIGIAPGAGEKNKIWPIKNFIEIAKYCESKNFLIVFFIGPNEKDLKEILKQKFPKSIFIEEEIKNFSNIEIIIATTKYLDLALSNDSGVSHMLSSGYCKLIKLFGPKESLKFTPNKKNLITISSKEFNSYLINVIPTSRVIHEINKIIN